MGKYNVEVTITAEVTYTVEVEADSESKADDLATAQWRTMTPDDFQVEKGYIINWETEAEQQTHNCDECGKEYPVTTGRTLSTEAWKEDQDYCAECGAKIEAEERGKAS